VVAESEIADAKVAAARRLRAAEVPRRNAVMEEANIALDRLSVVHGKAEQEARAELASLEATVLDLIVGMWRLAGALGPEHKVGGQMFEAAEQGVVSETERRTIASLRHIGLYPRRLDEDGVAATVSATEPILFDSDANPINKLDAWTGLIRVGLEGRKTGLQQ